MKYNFRVWDKKEKVMLKHVAVSIYFGIIVVENKYGEQIFDYELMQSSGLCDKHTVEIFQDDIVWDDMCSEYGVIKFKDANFVVDWGEYQTYLFDAYNDLEVVGNIYENLELLKGVEQ